MEIKIAGLLVFASSSVQFGELKATPEAVRAERLRSRSRERVERAEDVGEGAAKRERIIIDRSLLFTPRERGKFVLPMTVFRSYETKPDSECPGLQVKGSVLNIDR